MTVPSRWPRAVRPLRHGSYRRLAGVLAASLFAEGLWLVAIVWQVVALGGGPAQLSVVSGAVALGAVAAVLPGGVLADRVPQRRVLIGVGAAQVGAVAPVAAASLTGTLVLPALSAAGLVLGLAGGVSFPAYSALVPRLVPPDELQAVNGFEGVLRPVTQSAGGPALAGAIVAAAGPGVALGAVAASSGVALVLAVSLPRGVAALGLRAGADRGGTRAALAGAGRDLVDGFRYMVATRWLLVTLVFACFMILVTLGPLEVLVPFAVRDRAGGGPADHALVLALYGAGAAAGSFAAGSLRVPRRYLTVMIVLWSVATVPLAVFGLATSLVPMAVAAVVVGALFNAPQVIWGTLLQRRVPPGLLGRVSSLDFFVSLGLMPVSMAFAGPAAVAVGLTPVFLLAACGPVLVGAVALLVGRLGPDELAHPLDRPRDGASGATGDEDDEGVTAGADGGPSGPG